MSPESGEGKSAGKKLLLSAAVVAGLVLLCLAPFAGKAFHIDDPLFLWTARRIRENPLDFYGFSGNWFGREAPMYEAVKNPPLCSYYIALASLAAGWKETALHLALLLPALAAALGSFFLARRFCANPLAAALAGALSPVFILPGTQVMCDMTMLAFFVWALLFWIRGLERDEAGSLFAASCLVAAAALTKYFAASLIPLLLAFSLWKKKRPGLWLLFLLLPAAVLWGYQELTASLYGRGLLSDAARYAAGFDLFSGGGPLFKGLTGLAFTGGCAAAALFFFPLLWSRRGLVFWLLIFAAGAVLLAVTGRIGPFALKTAEGIRWGYLLQFCLFAVAGAGLAVLAAADFWRNRDGKSLLLFLWVAGTIVFAVFVNWTVNGRSLLPLAPAAGILAVRGVERRGLRAGPSRVFRLALPIAASALLGLLAAAADYRLAEAGRLAASEVLAAYGGGPGTVWFEGHWGFQYYMEEGGGRPIDFGEFAKTGIPRGDVLVIPKNNTNVFPPKDRRGRPVEPSRTLRFPVLGWMAVMSVPAGAGFYSGQWGPLPFVFGPAPPEEYFVYGAPRSGGWPR